MSSKFDWEKDIRTQAAQAGVTLTDATIEEIAEHLDDIHSAALAEGCGEQEAHARARRALDESTLDDIRRHPRASGASSRRPPVAAEIAAPPGGRSVNLAGALRVAVRQLRLRPGFAVVTVLVLALGIGASTTVFTIVDSVLLRPLPYAEPDRLVTLWDVNTARSAVTQPISPVNFMDYRELPAFKGAAAWWRPSLNLVDPGLDPVRVNAIEVSGNFFDVLGVRPQLGQGFPVGGPFFAGREPLVVISDRLWRSRYSSDPSIIGKLLTFNGRPHVVAGIMPPRFHYPDDIDVWQRLVWDLTQHSRGAHFMEAVLRLADGTTLDQAQIAADTLGQRLGSEFPTTNRGWSPKLVPLLEEQLGYYRPALFLLVGAVGLVLVIGCLNVASLLLTRALARDREIAVRVAMGASPRQLVTQLLAESLVLSAAGAMLGVIASRLALPALIAIAPAGIPRLDEAQVDLRALGLAIAIVATTTVAFGLVPALVLLRRKVTDDLRSGERGSTRGARRVYSVLVAGQMALACTLLVSSALLVRTVVKMVNTPTGLNADEVVTTSVQLPVRFVPPGPGAQEQWRARWRAAADAHARLLEQIRQQPGVSSAGAASVLPLTIASRLPFDIQGEDAPVRAEDRRIVQYHTITDGYFETMGAAIASGRFFTQYDTANGPPVVVVNEAFVARFLRRSPAAIGRQIVTNIGGVGPLALNLMAGPLAPNQTAPPRQFEVVGVVKDVLNAPLGQPVEPTIYFSAQQFPYSAMFLTIRAADQTAAVSAVRKALAGVAPTVPMGVVRTWGEQMATSTAEPRLLMILLTFFGVAAALLAALGVYGLFSWSVAQRTRELAIRLTLGAKPVSVGASVVRQSVALILIGLIVGLAAIRFAESALARVLFELSPHDPGSLLAASTLLVVVALGACIPAAVQALRVDPVEGLRAE